MSRVFEALWRSEREGQGSDAPLVSPLYAADLPQPCVLETDFDAVPAVALSPSANARLLALNGHGARATEIFHLLATRLRHLQRTRPIKKVLLTSSIAGEGKTLIAGNLAIALARSKNQRVVLLGGDLRRPGLSALFGMNGTKGLAEYLQGEAPSIGLMHKFESLPLWFLPAGSVPEHPLELLQSSRLSDLLQSLTRAFDWVIVDSPPLMFADATVLAHHVDGTLLVVREGKTPRKVLRNSVEGFGNLPLLGVIVNGMGATSDDYYPKSSYSG